jgi:uncharacterized protein
MNRKLILSALLFVVCCPSVGAQTGNSLLWRVSGNGLSKPSFLFGTIHLICPDDFLWTRSMEESIGACDKVCFEMDLGDPNHKRDVALAVIDKTGKKLKDYFPEDVYARIERYYADSIHIDLNRIQSFKPLILLSFAISKYTGCDSPVNYENRIKLIAEGYGKKITGLETPQQQMDIVDRTVTPEHIRMNVMTLVSGNRAGYDLLHRMIDYYTRQDLAATYHIIDSARKMGIINMDQLIDERNRNWVTIMPDQMRAASMFYAVGAGHLYGDNGVISLLRKAGYTVEPIIDTVNINNPATWRDLGSARTSKSVPKPGYDFGAYLSKNLHYPTDAREKGITGVVIVDFVVTEDGSISNCSIVKGLGGGCSDEALRVISTMPPWQPAINKDGQPIKAHYTQKVGFKLN